MREKACFKCGDVQPLDAFYRHPNMADGHLNKCKMCARRDVQDNYAKRRAQYQSYDKSRYKHRYQRGDFRPRDATKEKARITLHNAINRGKVSRPPRCERCHATCKPHGHHEDYSKPLTVQWLCRPCHGYVHRLDKQ